MASLFRATQLVAVLAAACAVYLALGSVGDVQAVASRSNQCKAYRGLPEKFGSDAHAGMKKVPGGSIQLGSREGYADERPSGEAIKVDSFWMDATEVTNAQFGAFVRATGYVTDAEREGAAAVFQVPAGAHRTGRDGEWWQWRAGATWRLPMGPSSGTKPQPNEPVVLVTYRDALAYAAWLGRDLPTEAEWEYAARGGGSAERVDREPRDPRGRPIANYWQGVFPDMNSTEDGFAALAPVGCFEANGYGLFDMIGNVWEFTRDRYTGVHQFHGNGDLRDVRRGRADIRAGELLVIKGGSFLCSTDYCVRYRSTARHAHEADLPISHVGFRTVLREAVASR